MRFLLDTHLLLWAASGSARLPKDARRLIEDAGNTPLASVASLWEVAIKHALRRDDFRANPHLLRRALLDNGYEELPIDGPHVVTAGDLPMIHKDPFDRLLVAQAIVEGVQLVTADATLAGYGEVVRLV